jgi:CHAT domain-containing protein
VAGANVAGREPDDKAPWDGLLTAYEVWGLDLQGTELVALTACETGLGVLQGAAATGSLRQPSGEVVAGLRQAFVVAGAKSMLMSMWPVPLNETVRSFGQFFDSWWRAGEGRYIAFRRSQLEALRYARERRGNAHPFWWAGFVYFGDPGDVIER